MLIALAWGLVTLRSVDLMSGSIRISIGNGSIIITNRNASHCIGTLLPMLAFAIAYVLLTLPVVYYLKY